MAYILIGYPILLAVAPGRPAPEVRKDPAFEPTVSVIVAVHNGASFLRNKLISILSLDYPQDRTEIFVVSDGSTDTTEAIASEFPQVHLLRQPHRGKAAALNLAIAQA